MITNRVRLEFIPVERKISDIFFREVVPNMKRDKIFLQREEDKRLDRLGIDAVMACKSGIEYVDLKHHAFSRLNGMHPQYAFELETGRDESAVRHHGWFVSQGKVTDVYGFLFWNGTPDHIEHMRVCLVRKEDVVKRLKSLGVDVENWKKYTMCPPKLYKGNHYWFVHGNIRIVKSLSFLEQPINLVVPWEYLEDIVIYDKQFCLAANEAVPAA